jgi:DNA-binding response OmpR family regulator
MLLGVIEKKLTSSGIDYKSFKLGKEALDFIDNSTELPDLIWLDYYLPDMNGIELLHEIRNRKEFDPVPVIVVSNSANDDTVAQLTQLGIKDYVIKAEHRLEDIVGKMIQVVKN